MKVFISTPIAGFDNEQKYETYRKSIMSLYNVIKNQVGKENVFAAFANAASFSEYDSPEESAKIDIIAIEGCDLFVLLYPRKIPTSALVELGYALAKEKKIVLVSPNLEVLPYMVQGLPHAYSEKVIWLPDDDLGKVATAICEKYLR